MECHYRNLLTSSCEWIMQHSPPGMKMNGSFSGKSSLVCLNESHFIWKYRTCYNKSCILSIMIHIAKRIRVEKLQMHWPDSLLCILFHDWDIFHCDRMKLNSFNGVTRILFSASFLIEFITITSQSLGLCNVFGLFKIVCMINTK